MKKNITFLVLLSVFAFAKAQQAFHNFGNVQIHDQGQVGFHIDLINDGDFNDNLGLVGFYNSNEALSISGSEIPRFFDSEIDVINNLFLDITTEISNSLTFTNGLVITPRNNINISLSFLDDSVYLFENDNRHTDGYASYSGNNEFIFPIGDDNKLRPLITPFQNSISRFDAAYFNEDPNSPSTFNNSFNTDNSEGIIGTVSNDEFWDFNGVQETEVTLTWDIQSRINELTDDLSNLRVVGWDNIKNEWVSLGNTDFTGNFNSGTITSETFIPSKFEIITFGSLVSSDDIIVHDGISPNGDGINDFFIIKGIEAFENTLEIYNRLQRLVFRATNYQNDWDGISNQNGTISQENRLPSGVYYYIVELPEVGRSFSGPLYLTN